MAIKRTLLKVSVIVIVVFLLVISYSSISEAKGMRSTDKEGWTMIERTDSVLGDTDTTTVEYIYNK